jgi:hypothetical protein
MSFSDKFCGKSPFKHFKAKGGAILNVHSHKDSDGEVSYHGQSRDTGRIKNYKKTKKGLVKDGSSVGDKGF